MWIRTGIPRAASALGDAHEELAVERAQRGKELLAKGSIVGRQRHRAPAACSSEASRL
jgi:hypothetical protein